VVAVKRYLGGATTPRRTILPLVDEIASLSGPADLINDLLFLFGSVYLPVNMTNIIFSKSDGSVPITPLGKIYQKHDTTNPATQPIMAENDLHSNDGKGLHDILSTKGAKALLKANSAWRAAYTDLASMTEKTPTVWNILHTGIQLAKTTPIKIPGWIDDDLPSSLIADAWVGAQQTFGALWIKQPPTVTFSPEVTVNPEVVANLYATATKDPPKKASPRPSLYLTRTEKVPQARTKAKQAYTTATYLHLTIPISVQAVTAFSEDDTALFSAIQEIWEAILPVEPNKTHILLWNDPDQV
jgi:hypothetical protein